MTKEQIERSPAAGLHTEVGKAGSVVLSLGAMVGPYLLAVHGRPWQALLAAGTVASIVLVQSFRLYRARLARRWKAVLDDHALREIARERRWKAPRSVFHSRAR
jgi:hypothetical protein